MKKILSALIVLVIASIIAVMTVSTNTPKSINIEPLQAVSIKAPELNLQTEKQADIRTEPQSGVAPSPSVAPESPTPELTVTQATTTPALEDDKNLYCSLLVSCGVLTDNMSRLDPQKSSLVPDDGIIFSSGKVVFYEGESAFNVLSREMKKNKIHLEFVKTPAYDSMYIEGIANLYQFDCGELSGWIYRVNGKVPSVGCSLYELKPGDRVEFLYTCDLGNDL